MKEYAMSRLAPAVLCAFLLVVVSSAHGDVRGTLFEAPDFAAGQPFTGAASWRQASFAGADHQIVANRGDVVSVFGSQSLRISNAATSGAFYDQTHSAALVDSAGEKTATNNGFTGGIRRSRFVASLRFASAGLQTGANPPQQPGLDVQLSPSNSGGGRMGFIRITDEPGGLKVAWNDFRETSSGAGAFGERVVADHLDRARTHLLVIAMWFKDGQRNDVAKIAVDGRSAFTATSWEQYYRDDVHTEPPAIDLMLFQTRATAVPALAGQGLLFDDVRVATPVFSPASGKLTPPVAPPPSPGGGGGGGGGGAAPVAGANVDVAADPAPLQLRSARLDRRAGRVRLVLFCPTAAGLCAGAATIRADHQNVVSRGFNQSGGARFPLTIPLSADARRRIARARKVQGLILSRDATGIATRLTRTLRG
jgi:hypothetical protein